MVILAMHKQIKFIFKVSVQALFGALGFVIANSVLAAFNIFVGINFVTLLIVGLLGFPGFISLYIINYIL